MSTFLGLPAPSSGALINTVLIGLAIPAYFGFHALARPAPILEAIKVPGPTDAAGRKLTDGLLRLYGIRNVSLWLAGTLVCLHGDARLVGRVAVAISLVPLVDGFIVPHLNGAGWRENWPHWVVFPIWGAVSAALMAA